MLHKLGEESDIQVSRIRGQTTYAFTFQETCKKELVDCHKNQLLKKLTYRRSDQDLGVDFGALGDFAEQNESKLCQP